MKTRWEFFFQVAGFRFDRKIRYVANADLERGSGQPVPEFGRKLSVEIEPDDKSIRPNADQTGKFRLQFDGTPEETKDFSYWAAYELTRRIAFENGEMDIMPGLVFWERIPETEEEEAEFGNNPYGAELHLEEVREPAVFDPSSVQRHDSNQEFARLMAQHNESKRSRTPVEKFLGFFRVLEHLYSGYGGHKKLESALIAAPPLRRHVEGCTEQTANGGPITDEQCSDIIKRLHRTRHRCAHLKEKFGIAPCDREIETEVEPLLPVVEEASYRGIVERFANPSEGGAQGS